MSIDRRAPGPQDHVDVRSVLPMGVDALIDGGSSHARSDDGQHLDPMWISIDAAVRIERAVGVEVPPSTKSNLLWHMQMSRQLQDATELLLRACAGRTSHSALRDVFVRRREGEFWDKVRDLLPRDYWMERAPALAARRAHRAQWFAREFSRVRAEDPAWRRSRGRPTEYELDALVDSLAWIWMEHYERPCRASFDATRGRSGISTGPFVEFVRACAHEIASTLADPSFAHPISELLTPESREDLFECVTALSNDPSAVRGRIEKLKRVRERDPSTGRLRSRSDGPVAVLREIEIGLARRPRVD